VSRAQAKRTALLSWLVVGACVATIAEVAEAADAAIYRMGDFEKADVDMASCPADALGKRHPELTLAIAATPRGELALSGARSTNAGGALWTIVTRKTGDNASHVVLLNRGATPDEIEEVWLAIEACGKQ
jgi:hypothetical protein